jgi:hypothetical protein
MPRVKPRTSIYGVLPILASVIMVGSIVLIFIFGIKPYQRNYALKEGPAPVRAFPEPEAPSKAVAEDKIPTNPEDVKEKGKEEVAPPAEGEKGKGEAPPGEGAEAKKEPPKEEKQPPKDDTKAPKEETKQPKDEKKEAGGEKGAEEKK